jgi:hypothetical protein
MSCCTPTKRRTSTRNPSNGFYEHAYDTIPCEPVGSAFQRQGNPALGARLVIATAITVPEQSLNTSFMVSRQCSAARKSE